VETENCSRTATVNGLPISYQEAGNSKGPAILLLHDLPASSAMFRDLIPSLADRFRVIAPDYVDLTRLDAPSSKEPTLGSLTERISGLIDILSLSSLIVYVQGHAGPIGFHLFAERPEQVVGLIIQNANAHVIEGIGSENPKAIGPDDKVVGGGLFARSRTAVHGVDLSENHEACIRDYSRWQAAFRKHQPKTLIIWGKNDPFFIPPGARAYLNDLPDARLVWFDSGRFVLDDNVSRIAAEIKAAFISTTGGMRTAD
jgi:pimeloyl-ACP methyl ester carboxylesterase